MGSYHNTNTEVGLTLANSEKQVKSQEELILAYFSNNPALELTPFEVQERLGFTATPITSIRRAMSNLATQDKLEKTDKQKEGQHGKMNYCWRLKIPEAMVRGQLPINFSQCSG